CFIHAATATFHAAPFGSSATVARGLPAARKHACNGAAQRKLRTSCAPATSQARAVAAKSKSLTSAVRNSSVPSAQPWLSEA
ncbi:MAG: hypothetical protein Q7J84_17755, partial [Sulfuricaulis sp.]|nr:hypothetical protein [Sulfuricaulis sp.]